jgi:hypothetical protein
MALTIAQSALQIDEDRWEWSVWIEGSEAELGNVQEVTWHLHSSFKTPIRRVSTPANKFMISSSGWGEFLIFARIQMKNGRKKSLQHWLELFENRPPNENEPLQSKTGSQQTRAPSVFLSSSLDNANLAAHLAQELAKIDYNVVRDIDVPAGVNLHDWNLEQIARSNAVIVLGADESLTARSPELRFAQSKGVQVIPVSLGRSTKKFAGTKSGKFQALNFAMGAPSKVAPTIATSIGKILKT